MESLGKILGNKNLNTPLIKGLRASEVIAAAESILVKFFGDPIKTHASPAYYKNHTLTIACLSSTVAQEIRLHENALIAAINEKVPNVEVSKIRYLS